MYLYSSEIIIQQIYKLPTLFSSSIKIHYIDWCLLNYVNLDIIVPRSSNAKTFVFWCIYLEMPSLRKRVTTYLRQLSFSAEPRDRIGSNRLSLNKAGCSIARYVEGYIYKHIFLSINCFICPNNIWFKKSY